SAREIQRKYDLTEKSAWFLLHRIREAMANDQLWKMTGTVVADETFIGGVEKNRHAKDRKQGVKPKTTVLTLVNKTTGEARSRVIPNVTSRTLKRELQRHVHPAATLHTDSNASYNDFGEMVAEHETVNHTEGEYVRDGKIST